MSAAKPCPDDLTAAVACINLANPGQCGCMDTSTFADKFEQDVRANFLSTQAFAAPSDPAYCGIANKRVCQFTDMNYSCCCQDEIAAYQRCLVETVLPQELPPPVAYETSTCQNVCPPPENGGSSMPMLIGCAVGIAVVVCLIEALLCRWRRRRRAMKTETGDKNEECTNTSQSGVFEVPNGDEPTTQHLHETTIEEPVDLENGAQTFASSDDDDDGSWDPKSTVEDEPVYKSRMAPSKAFIDEAEEFNNSKDLKADILKKKRAIENWNKDRKEGSNRSLQSYLKEEEFNSNPSQDDEEKNNPEKKNKEERRPSNSKLDGTSKERPRSSRQLADAKEDTAQTKTTENDDKKTSKDSSKDRPRRSSSRRLLDDEDEKGEDDEIKAKAEKPRRSSSRQRLDAEDEDTSKKQKSKEKDSDKPRRSSSRNVLDADEDDRKKEQDSKADIPRRSSSNRLNAEDGQRDKKTQDSGTDRPRRSSSRNRLDADDNDKSNKDPKASQDASTNKLRRSSSKNRLDADGNNQRMPRSSSKNRLDTEEDNQRMRRSSSKNRLDTEDDNQRMPRSSSKNRLDTEDDNQRMRRSSSKNRLDTEEDNQRLRRSSSKNRLDTDYDNQKDSSKKDKKSKESSAEKPRRSSSRCNLNEDDEDDDDVRQNTKGKEDRKKSKESSTDRSRPSSSRSLRDVEDDEKRHRTSSRRD